MVGTLTDDERSKIEKSHKEFKHFIKIPRRYHIEYLYKTKSRYKVKFNHI